MCGGALDFSTYTFHKTVRIVLSAPILELFKYAVANVELYSELVLGLVIPEKQVGGMICAWWVHGTILEKAQYGAGQNHANWRS